MQTRNAVLDEFARVMSSAMGAASGVRSEVESRLRDQFERILNQMDIVSRAEFDAMRAVAVAAREESESLKERLAVLEARLEHLEK